MSNKKTILFVMTLMILLLGLTVVSASQTSDNDTVTIADSPNTSLDKQSSVSNDVIQEQSSVKTSQNAINDVKSDKVITTDKNTKNIKTAGKTIIINNNTFSNYFDSNGYLNSNVSDGDVLDFQGRLVGSQYNMIINKSVNITSSTKNAYIDLNTTATSYFGDDDVTAFTMRKGASCSNVTGIYFHNTQIFIRNAHDIKINNISAIVENQRVGSGTGQTSIRDNSSRIIVENSTFSTKNNGGSSTLVLAWASNCKINNNTLIGIGEVGNLLYLTTYNVDGINETESLNDNNTLSNNTIYGREEPSSICYGIAISGKNNLVINNTIHYNGTGITTQWITGEESQSINNIVTQNTLDGCTLVAPVNGTVTNNTLTGENGILTPSEGAIVENNTMSGLNLISNTVVGKNTVNGDVIIQLDRRNITIENLTVKGDIYTIAGTSTYQTPNRITLKNNNITGNLILNGTNNTLIENNDINGQIILGGRNNRNNNITITDNNITTNKEYGIFINKTSKNITIKDNYIVGQKTGDNSTYINATSSTVTIENNIPPCDTFISITAASGLVNEKIVLNATITNIRGYPVTDGQIVFKNGSQVLGTYAVTNGKVSQQVSFSTTGTKTITASYTSTLYNPSNSTVRVNIDKVNIKTTGDLIYNVAGHITINVTNSTNNAVTTGTYNVVVGGKTQNVQFKNGVATFTYTPNSINNVLVTTTYTSPSGVKVIDNTNLSVKKANTTISVAKVNGLVNETITIRAVVVDQAGKNVTNGNVVFIDANTSKQIGNATVSNGIATTTTKSDTSKLVNITANYAGSQLYNPSTTKSTVNIDKINIKTTGDLIYNVAGHITINVTNSTNKAVTTGSLNVIVAGKTQNVQFNNGIASFNYAPTSTSNVVVTTTYTSPSGFKVVNSTSLPVKKANTTTSVAAVNGLVNDTVTIKAVIVDQSGKNVANGNVIFVDNSAAKTIGNVTVSNGTATITTKYSTLGLRNITANYTGSQVYNPSTAKSTVTIYDVAILFNANLTYNKTSPITIQVVDSNKKPVNNGTLSIKVNGKAQSATFKNGISTFNYTPSSAKDVNVSATYSTITNSTIFNVKKLNTTTKASNLKTLINQTITIKAEVTNEQSNKVNEGTVSFMEGSKTLGTAKVSNGAATINTKFDTAGNKTITIKYDNATSHNPSTTTLKVTIEKLSTTTKATANNTLITQTVTINATVTDSNGKVAGDGTVSFIEGGKTLGTVKVTNGKATYNTKFDTVGTKTITVNYTGSNSYNPSTTTVKLTIYKLNTTTKATANNALINQTVTISANVTDSNGKAVNDGTVSFIESGKTLGTVKLANGKVTYTTKFTTSGTKTVTVNYTGATAYNPSTTTVKVTISKLNVQLACNASNTSVNQTVSFKVEVKDQNGARVKEGKVIFTEGTKNIGTINVSNGFAILNTQFDTPGTKTIKATFNATNSFNQASINIPLTVNKLNTSMKVTVTPISSYINQSIVIKANVSDQTGKAVNDGKVLFAFSNNTTKTVNVVKGIASITTKFAEAGTNTVSLTYQNTTPYVSSKANANVVIDKLSTTTTITTVRGVIGNQLTLTAKLVDQFNNPVINGYVIFKLNGITIKDNKKLTGSSNGLKVYVNKGIATVNITADLDMRHAKDLQSVYAGSSSYLTSRSNNATVEIALRNASITVKTNVKTIKQGQNLTLTATVKDITGGKTSNILSYEGQYVYFKVNGITIKDSKGKTVQAKIVNGVATTNYTIPLGLSGVTDGKTLTPKNHTVMAGFVNPNYYPTARAINTFQVERSNITINFQSIVINKTSNKLAVNATIKDYLGNNVLGPNKYIIKVNGATIKNGNSPKYFYATNGIIKESNITIPTFTSYNSIEIVTQDRLSYKNQRNTTKTIRVVK